MIRKTNSFILFLCALLTLITGLIFVIKKDGLYEDEIVSYGQANSYYAAWTYDIYPEITSTSTIKSYISEGDKALSYLAVDSGERFSFASVYDNSTKDVHPPLYHFLLNIISSFFAGTYSVWFGLILNLIIWILTVFMIFITCMKLFDNSIIPSSIAAFAYGICQGTIENLTLIRMYILLGLIVAIMLYIMVSIISNKDSIAKWVFPLITLMVLTGFYTQYGFATFAFSFFAVLCIQQLHVSIKRALLIGISALCGLMAFILSYPAFFNQFTGGNHSTYTGYGILQGIGNVTILWQKIMIAFGIIKDSTLVELIFGITILTLVIIYYFTHGKNAKSFKDFWGASNLIGNIISITMIFILSVSLTAFISPSVDIPRYYNHLLPMAFILIGYVVFILQRNVFTNRHFEIFTACICGLLFVCNLVYLSINPPRYLFSGYRAYTDIISEHSGQNAIYVMSDDYGIVQEDAIQFLYMHDKILFTISGNLDSNDISDFVSGNNKEIVCYLSTNISDSENAINKLLILTDFSHADNLFKTNRSDVYILEK